jgi:hypothetical protein
VALMVLVVELDLPENGSSAEALAATARRLQGELPVEPRRVWAGVRETAQAVAELHGGPPT